MKSHVFGVNAFKAAIKRVWFFAEERPMTNSLLAASQTKYVWRNNLGEGYKVSESYKDQPMDLSNYLLQRTREWQYATTNFSEGQANALADSHKAIATDLEAGFQ